MFQKVVTKLLATSCANKTKDFITHLEAIVNKEYVSLCTTMNKINVECSSKNGDETYNHKVKDKTSYDILYYVRHHF